MYGVRLRGIGGYLPERRVSNEEITTILSDRLAGYIDSRIIRSDDPRTVQFESDPQWIEQRTGIKERRFAPLEQATSDLAVEAARVALEVAELDPGQVDFVYVATVSPDYNLTPSTASIIQHQLGIPVENGSGLRCFRPADMSLACSSFLMALDAADSSLRAGKCRVGLVIGADTSSRYVSWDDRNVLPLMGDGAGCVILERTHAGADQFGPKNFFFGADGSQAHLIQAPVGGSRTPLCEESVARVLDPFERGGTIKMDGGEVFRWAIRFLPERVIPQALELAEVRLPDVGAIIFHQANARIIDAVVERLDYRGLVYNNISFLGNTASASIPLALCGALGAAEDGSFGIESGMQVLIVAFGGGLTWGTALFRYEGFPGLNGSPFIKDASIRA